MIITASQHFITDNISHNITTCYHTPYSPYTPIAHHFVRSFFGILKDLAGVRHQKRIFHKPIMSTNCIQIEAEKQF